MKNFLIVVLLIVGGIVIKFDEQRIYMIKVVMDNATEVKKFVYDEDNHHNVKSITIDYANIDHNLMGGINVGGYVNGDKQMDFDTVLDKDLDTGKIYYGAGLMSQKLGRLLDTK